MNRRWLVTATTLLAVGTVLAIVLRRAPSEPSATFADPVAQVTAACGGCHPLPPPDTLPRRLWRTEVERMARMAEQFLPQFLPQGDAGATPFDEQAVISWYEHNAPERLALLAPLPRDATSPLRFRRRLVHLGAESGPSVATVHRIDTEILPDFAAVLATANMSTGAIHLFSLEGGPRLIGVSGHPARVVAGDIDGDGREDLVISDLGSTSPTEEPAGRVVVAINTGDGNFGFRTVFEGVGRIADARPIDLDGDGDLDIAVASFGFLRAGGIFVLHNESDGALAFRAEQISSDTGAVSIVPVNVPVNAPVNAPVNVPANAPVTAIGADTRPGFAVAFSQHHERVSIFYPDAGGWKERVLYRAPHPNWGISNLEAVDLDRDGDTDFLLAHGDTLDDGLAFKPYHGVQWLENTGGIFRSREIGALYGAHRAEAGDLDGDGDLDVVACGFLPQVQLPVPEDGFQLDSLIWFERSEEEWIPRAIESNHPRHTGLTLVDLDGDGNLDIAAAINRAWDIQEVEEGPSLEVWFNEGPDS